jgi:hypothetical protein
MHLSRWSSKSRVMILHGPIMVILVSKVIANTVTQVRSQSQLKWPVLVLFFLGAINARNAVD